MQSIGERLEDARKRQGISVREAAEATKIRADFLIEFENNNFNQDLPEIYKRGFLKLYAKFLGLDGDRLVADYHSLVLGHSPIPKKTESREYLGRVETSPTQDTAYIIPEEEEDYTADGYTSAEDKTLYLKIGIAVGSTVLVLVLLAIIIKIASGGDDSSDDTTAATEQTYQTDTTTPTTPSEPVTFDQPKQITLEAKEEMFIIVRETGNRTAPPLYKGGLSAGETKTFTVNKPLDVASDTIQGLIFDIDGERFNSGDATGARTVTVPQVN